MTTNAILTAESEMTARQSRTTTESAASPYRPSEVPPSQDFPKDDPRWNAVLARDAAHDGEFVFAVSSTGVYCRPSCPARRPRRENVQFFLAPAQAEQAGYRACLRCRPKSISGNRESDAVKSICRFIEQHLDEPLTLQESAARLDAAR
jgi:AraC family transcriptional regulator of adaptative response/methylated-DNA-[protein]-cysteine methyltransferase